MFFWSIQLSRTRFLSLSGWPQSYITCSTCMNRWTDKLIISPDYLQKHVFLHCRSWFPWIPQDDKRELIPDSCPLTSQKVSWIFWVGMHTCIHRLNKIVGKLHPVPFQTPENAHQVPPPALPPPLELKTSLRLFKTCHVLSPSGLPKSQGECSVLLCWLLNLDLLISLIWLITSEEEHNNWGIHYFSKMTST